MEHENNQNIVDDGSKRETLIVINEEEPEGYAGVFEDDGITGYLYVHDTNKGKIIKHLQIYNEAETLALKKEEIGVIWSEDWTKCGVVIFGGIRGIIDLKNNFEARVFMTDRNTPPVGDEEWLTGFEWFFS